MAWNGGGEEDHVETPVEPRPDNEDIYGWVAEGVAAQRARRRRLLAFWGTLAAVLVGGLGVFGLLSLVDDDGTTEPRDAAPGTTGQVAEVAADPVELEWHAIPGTLGFSERLFASADGTFYALSTAPGRNATWPAPRALYTSVDGENWDANVLADDVTASDMAVRNGIAYLIGTAPSFNAVDGQQDAMISTSGDGGLSWKSTVLPLPAATVPGGVDAWTHTTMKIAASEAAVVAIVQRVTEFDYWSLVPQGLLEVGNRGVEPTATGVDIVDYQIFEDMQRACEEAGGNFEFEEGDAADMPEPCRLLMEGELRPSVIGSFTWEELGLPEGVAPTTSQVFVSSDGVEFDQVDGPFAAGQLSALHSFGNGFLASEWDFQGRMTMWESPDGRVWERFDDVAFDWVAAAGTFAGDRVLIGGNRGGPAIAWETADGWVDVDLDAAVGLPRQGWINAAAVGPLGVVAVINSFDELRETESVSVLHGSAPDDWELIEMDDIVGGQGFTDWVVVGPDHVLLRYVQFDGGQRPGNLQVIGIPESA